MLKEYFGGMPGYLPEGSVVMFGSVSHLSRRGIENYTEECVKIKKVLSNMLSKLCTVTHVVFVPLGGVEGPGLVRDLYDLDIWLRGSGHDGGSLPDTRTLFWKKLPEPGHVGEGDNSHDSRVLFMPESISVSNKIRFVSGSVRNKIPEKSHPWIRQLSPH
jgi:hypothetical protein